MTSVPIDRVLEEVRRTFRRGDLVKTVGMIRELARQAGHDPRSRHLQAKLAIEFGQSREAVGLLETLVFEMTGDELREATIDLARAREQQGDYEGGLTTIRPELEADDTPAAAIAVAARLRFKAGDEADAIKLLDDATPADNEAYEIAATRAAIALATPADHPDRAAREKAAIDALTTESERVGLPASSLMRLLLDLGELNARQGNDEAATRAWKRSTHLSPYRVDPRSYGQAVGGLLKSWSDSNLSRARVNESGEAAESERPLFVVGMPGGGAQLVADLLAASPDAARTPDPEALTAAVGRNLAPANAGGQPVVPDPSKLSGKQIAGAADHYLNRTAPSDGADPAARVIDAFELNLHTLGIVAQLFPKARVVFVKRPTDDALIACMLAHRDPRLLYAADQGGLAVFAGGIARLADLWAGIFSSDDLPLAHKVVDFDAIVGDASARDELFKFAGITAPPADEAERVIAAHTRFTQGQSGIAARFAPHLPNIAQTAKQIGFDTI